MVIQDFENFTNHEIVNFFKIGQACDALFLDEENAWMNRYQFNEKWGEHASMGMFTNGSGDDLLVIVRDGIFLKGFDHESPGIGHQRFYENIPCHLDEELRDPAIEFENVTFCYWRTDETGPFSSSSNPGLGGFLLSTIHTSADAYLINSRDYFEGIDIKKEAAIRQIFRLK